jgi:3',5'-cyclic AMP phosphodiesterase CpdA
MKRRDFIKRVTALAASPAISPAVGARSAASPPRPSSTFEEGAFPYDIDFFEAAERFVFLNENEAVLNIIPKEGKSLDIRFYRPPGELSISGGSSSASFTAVDDSLDIPLSIVGSAPEFTYKLEYRETGSGAWRLTPERRVKTPSSFTRTGRLEAIFISDDHTYDDADQETRIVRDPYWRERRLNGEYVNDFLRSLRSDPIYYPPPESDLRKMMNGFTLASTIDTVLRRERPDFIILGGDATGIGSGYKWAGLGLKDPAFGLSEQEYDDYARLFWLRMRRMLSGLTPEIPVYLCQGNHDGESGYDTARVFARKYRKKYFKQPGVQHGSSAAENYFQLIWGPRLYGNGFPQFLILDNESYNATAPVIPEDWTIGSVQKAWLQTALGYETDWKFAFFHHVLGGWPRGSNETTTTSSYGRGPLYIASDYADYVSDPQRVEQVELTRIMRAGGVNAAFFGHDHIFQVRDIPSESGGAGRKIYGIRMGSPKWFGEDYWYKGALWQKHYGSYGFYQADGEPFSPVTDFWGPAGYTKLIIDENGARVDYIRSGDSHPWTNIPPEIGIGDTVASVLLGF